MKPLNTRQKCYLLALMLSLYLQAKVAKLKQKVLHIFGKGGAV
ncbi:hypothetical protein [Thiolinea disciformis]|nr:hypothetical protein [Thiolinea disciformis]